MKKKKSKEQLAKEAKRMRDWRLKDKIRRQEMKKELELLRKRISK